MNGLKKFFQKINKPKNTEGPSPWEKAQKEFNAEQKRHQKRLKKEKERKKLEYGMPSLLHLRRHTLVIRFMALMLFFSVMAYLMIYFISPVSRVSVVTVTGIKDLGDQSVVNASKIHSGEALWPTYFKRNQTISQVKKELPKVKNATISITNFNDIKIDVREYQTVGVLLQGKSYFPILENGKILEESEMYIAGKYPVYGSFSEGPILDRMIVAYNQLDKKIKNSISEVDATGSVNNPYQIKLYMNDGNVVIASMLNFGDKMKYYAEYAAQMKKKGVLDIEVGTFSTAFETVKKNQEKEDRDKQNETHGDSQKQGD